MKQVKPLPPTLSLAPSLAQRVYQLRDFRNMTVRDLAKLARFAPARIEDIESGLETWLSTADRQLLAKALSIEPAILQEVEARQNIEGREQQQAILQKLRASILEGNRDQECPQCGNTLKCGIQEGFDLNGMPITFAKAFCLKCPFVLR